MRKPVIILDDANRNRMRIFTDKKGEIRADRPGELAAALAAMQYAWEKGLFVAGYFSYELGYALEAKLAPLLPSRRAVPLLWFGLFGPPQIVEGDAVDAAFDDWGLGRAYAGRPRFDWDPAAYDRRFATIRELIHAGDLYQTNLTFGGGFDFHGDALALYRDLRGASAVAHGAYVDDGARTILSLSPELFFDLAGGWLTAKPMKGTAPRQADPAADAAAGDGLRASPKDRAENLMIVDLMRNDLGRIAATGSVSVRDLFAVESYPTVHQMVSTVRARLRPDIGVAEIVRALFPCGSVTGAPKIRAMQAIRELEDGPRGVYCGAVGCFAPEFAAQFNVAIRTLTITAGRGRFGIGGAVVQDSQSGGEYDECLLKARFLTQARRRLELIETMRFSPQTGLVRLRLHMARLKRSAKHFAIPFDGYAVYRSLAAAVRNAVGETLVRLAMDEDGYIHATTAPLPPAPSHWRYAIAGVRIACDDPLAAHKTNLRDVYEREFARLRESTGCDEAVFVNRRGELAEGRRSNIFLADGAKLLTPPLASGALNGCLRRELLDQGRAVEAVLRPADLDGEVYFGNSLRGLIRAISLRPEPRPWTGPGRDGR